MKGTCIIFFTSELSKLIILFYFSCSYKVCRCNSSSQKDDKTDQQNYLQISIFAKSYHINILKLRREDLLTLLKVKYFFV